MYKLRKDYKIMEKFNIKIINTNDLKTLGLDQDALNIINATIAQEFQKCVQIITKYSSKKQEFLKIYNDENDVRIMFFTKIINTLYSYFLERVLINGLVENDKNTQDFLKRAGVAEIINNWNTFKFSHNFYNAFVCYIRIFSCLESSLREIHYYLGLNPNNKFISFYQIYQPLIKKNGLNSDYKNLLKLLANIRNLIHNMGVSNKTEIVTYKNTTYEFKKDQIPKPGDLNLINLLNLFENDILDLISDLFNAPSIKQITSMPDNLSTDINDFKNWLIK